MCNGMCNNNCGGNFIWIIILALLFCTCGNQGYYGCGNQNGCGNTCC